MMTRFLCFLTLVAFTQISISSPLSKRWGDLVEKHAWVEIPQGWEYHSAAPPDHTLDLRIGLKQDRFDELVESLYQVSDPFHERYGSHLSKEEVDTLVAPHPDSIENVDSWLIDHGIDLAAVTRSSAGEWINLRIPVEQVERLLGTTYNVYRHKTTNTYVVRTMSYSLPRALHSHIDVVSPTTYFSTIQSLRKTSFLQPEIAPITEDHKFDALAPVPASCATTITPACLRGLYNTVNYTPTQTSRNRLGVAGYLEEYANRADLQTFLRRFRTDAVGATFNTTRVNGGLDDQTQPGVEANLDIQYTVGMSFPTPNIYWSTGGSPPFNPDSQTPTNTNEPYLNWVNFVLNSSSIPQTITTSYGDDEQTVPRDYATSVCNLFAQLGALGTTMLFSSGDFGVGGGDCRTNDGTNTVKFQPAFPASCPFVTAVGGTTRVAPEVAVSFTGGGFSNYFVQPSYQTAAVSTFLTSLGTTFSGLFNRTGRAYPDLAAQGNGFQVVIGGQVGSVGGTSASSPTVAGVIALLNDYRLSLGKSSLGFLNPLIYSSGRTAFNDITSGSNPGCGTSGFTARAGWDPLTGLGTPDFVKLQAVVQAAA